MFNSINKKAVGKVFSYQNILSPCCFDSITSFPPTTYALLKEADGSSACAMEHLIKSRKEAAIIHVVQSKDMKGKIFWIKSPLECNRKGKM